MFVLFYTLSIHGKPAISITNEATLTSTRTHQQGKSEGRSQRTFKAPQREGPALRGRKEVIHASLERGRLVGGEQVLFGRLRGPRASSGVL